MILLILSISFLIKHYYSFIKSIIILISFPPTATLVSR
nr:MAG TPA: hypothetical protein [Caudoviricetes sp.]